MQLYRYFVSQCNEFCRHNPLWCFSTSVYCCCSFRYRLSPESFGYMASQPRRPPVVIVTLPIRQKPAVRRCLLDDCVRHSGREQRDFCNGAFFFIAESLFDGRVQGNGLIVNCKWFSLKFLNGGVSWEHVWNWASWWPHLLHIQFLHHRIWNFLKHFIDLLLLAPDTCHGCLVIIDCVVF